MSEQRQPFLFTGAEWAAMTEGEKAVVRAVRRREVEGAQAEHEARKRLNDSLTVERFGHEHG